MRVERLNTTLPKKDKQFIENYKKLHTNYKSDASVISHALNLLREIELKKQYSAANAEIDHDLDVLDTDGLTSEDW